jgi:hypothetical protein
MAKVTISVSDEANGSVGIEVQGDFEKDLSKCTKAQKAALEGLVFMLRDAKIQGEGGCDESECGGCCGCHGEEANEG